MTVTVSAVPSGIELPVTARAHVDHYNTFGRDGHTIGTIVIPARGQYAVIAKGGGGNNVAIGKVPPRRWYVWAWVWFGLAVVAFLIAVSASVVVLRERRSRSVDPQDLVSA